MLSKLKSEQKEKAVFKIVRNRYNDGVRLFCYAIEVVGVPHAKYDPNKAGHVDFIGCINSTPSIDGGEGYFQGGSYICEDKKTGEPRYASSIKGILSECGFTSWHSLGAKSISKLRVPCVFYVNLMCPVIDWLGSAGKTRIDLKPFTSDIAKTISDIAYKMPTFRGRIDKPVVFDDELASEVIVKHELTQLLRKRWEEVKRDSSLKIRDGWTQSTVFYTLRPILIDIGYEPPKNWGKTRKYITGQIDKICKAEFRCEREALGITAAARGVLYLNGETYRVAYGKIEELARKGVAIVFIEKEGVVDVLASHASEYGVALVNTQGRFVKYVKRLIKAAKESGAKVAILTDCDAIGFQIAEAASEVIRIGIDRIDTITYFREHGFPNLTQDQHEEEYSPNVSTEYMEDGKYLKTKRIELDSLISAVGPQELWKFVMHQLNVKFPKNMTYDYTRIISDPIPSLADPDPVSDVTEYIEYIKDKAARPRWKEIVETDLQSAKDLIKVDDKEQEIDDELLDLITNYELMKKEIIPKFEDLKIELEIDSDEDFAKYRKDRIEQQQAAKAKEAVKPVDDVKDDYDYDSETEEEERDNDDDDGRVERGGGGGD